MRPIRIPHYQVVMDSRSWLMELILLSSAAAKI